MSYAPEPDDDGFRYYNRWAGRPAGVREDCTRCIMSVSDGQRWPRYHQCDRKRGFGPDGLYCKQHDPAVAEARRKEADRRAEEKWNNRPEARMRRALESAQAALRAIADGHNDPRTLARETLEKKQ